MKLSKKEKLLRLLENRGELGITGLDVFLKLRTFEYRKIISRLRREGYNITDTWEKNGKESKYKRYYLEG